MNERIKQLRKELGLSQLEFGERLGMTDAFVSRIESGARPIIERTAKAICREFGVDPRWLETGEGEMFSSSDDRTLAAISDLLEREDNLGKALLKTIATFTDDEWTLLKKMLDKLIKEYGGSQLP